MKILIAAEGDDLNAKVARRFGNANYFIIYDTETKKYVAIENFGGQNRYKLLNFLSQGILHYIVGNIGPQAFETLNQNGATVYLARGLSVKQAIENIKNLEILTHSTLKRSIHQHRKHNHH